MIGDTGDRRRHGGQTGRIPRDFLLLRTIHYSPFYSHFQLANCSRNAVFLTFPALLRKFPPETRNASMASSSLPPLRAVPDRSNDNSLPPNTVDDDIGRASNDQLANAGSRPSTPQIRIVPEGLDYCHDAYRQTLRRTRLIVSHILLNFFESKAGPRRPNDIYRHYALLIVILPANALRRRQLPDRSPG